ncbi:MAG: methyltransferase domain-containing protein [Oscillospiraceae bacterium]|nr:methyltransferase domain-containing protein [Oscillospiraceae bacterium]
MKKTDIAAFFDRCAPWWDSDMIRNEDIITRILDNGGIREGVHVLDVACGTGVLFPDYLVREVASITAIDISPEMAKIAAAKYPQVNVICGDVESTAFDRQFDCIMVYNAFPHFPDPVHLVEVLAGLLKPGGRLSVAHGMSRAALCDHHAGRAANVSIDLLHEQELAEVFSGWFDVDVVISDDQMYQVSGIRREGTAHSHGGRHMHVHSHDHDHSHGGGTPMEELLALMKYMVGHNDAHAQELTGLAGQLKEAGKLRAYREIMDAVAGFDIANAKLDAVLQELTEEKP